MKITGKLKYDNLHLRNSADLVQIAKEYGVSGQILHKGKSADINSIIEIISLFAKIGDRIEIIFDNPTAQMKLENFIRRL